MTINDLNGFSTEEFVQTLGSIFEHSPWVAKAAHNTRPYANVAHLHASMLEAVLNASQDQQLALIRSHPDLGAKLKMTQESIGEQAGVGLDKLVPELFERFSNLNARYRQKFGFPFIVAVRNHTRQSILENFELRLHNTPQQEQQAALREIGEIARFRLEDLLSA